MVNKKLGLIFIFFFSGSSMGSEKALLDLQAFFKNGRPVLDSREISPGNFEATPSSSVALTKFIQEFLQKGGNPNTVLNPSTGDTLLHLSSHHRYKSAVSLLLENQADINIQNKRKQTPLCLAILGEALGTACLLLAKGADPNQGECQAFHLAITKYALPVAKAMLKSVNINEPDNEGWTALHEAATHQELDVVKWLIDNGANASARDNRGETALHLIAEEGDDDHETLEIIKELLRAGASPYAKNDSGETPLEIGLHNLPNGSKTVHLLQTEHLLSSPLSKERKKIKPKGANQCDALLREAKEKAEEHDLQKSSPKSNSSLEQTIEKVEEHDLEWNVKSICEEERQESIFENTKNKIFNLSTTPNCEIGKKIAKMIRLEYSWLQDAKRSGLDIKFSQRSARGVITLHDSPDLRLSLKKYLIDCFFFPCWENTIALDVLGMRLYYKNCEGRSESSECYKKLEEWKQILKSGRGLKIYFRRSIHDRIMGVGWHGFLNYYIYRVDMA